MKFSDEFEADFTGGIGAPEKISSSSMKNVNVEYSDEIFDYDEKKQDLVLDRIPDITRDCVSFRNNLALFELHAVQ